MTLLAGLDLEETLASLDEEAVVGSSGGVVTKVSSLPVFPVFHVFPGPPGGVAGLPQLPPASPARHLWQSHRLLAAPRLLSGGQVRARGTPAQKSNFY